MSNTIDTTGSKYTAGLDIAQIARLVRIDIKAAIADGALPVGKYSVRVSRYSIGQSLNLTATVPGVTRATNAVEAKATVLMLQHIAAMYCDGREWPSFYTHARIEG